MWQSFVILPKNYYDTLFSLRLNCRHVIVHRRIFIVHEKILKGSSSQIEWPDSVLQDMPWLGNQPAYVFKKLVFSLIVVFQSY